MISKAKIKLIHSLELKKFRNSENAFLAEGHKLVGDVISKFPAKYIAATKEWIDENSGILREHQKDVQVDCVTYEELSKASLLKSPQDVIAVFERPNYKMEGLKLRPERELCLALDGVQDPGNIGTIVRIADWFGIETIFCSNNSVDVFSPKAIQATMGAIGRVSVVYCDLKELFANCNCPIYGTFLNGRNIYTEPLTSNGIIVMGNEGNGISPEVEKFVTDRITIPNYPADRPTSESLNVAIATSIVCSEFRRR
ncbi:MAG: RNA methyltransferase [Bacteroidaceae bacterium]|nr:RNA methyltransferase [Bacteroidaceae bacterium]